MSSVDYTPTTWGTPDTFDFKVPSGQLCKVRKIQMEDIVELGLLENLDFLSSVVDQELIDPVTRPAKKPQDRQKKRPTKAEQESSERSSMIKLMQDPSKFKSLMTMVDKIVVAAVVEPSLALAIDADGNKIPRSERQGGRIYSDSIGIEDKMTIFDAAFRGVAQMQPFRSGSEEGVGTVADEPGPEEDSE